ncbi:CynX/NimT family MFS transporter [Psychrobacter sp. I-STPA6b]|uniref:MFS transporter n=1 Tax=Psychrobacter sp. I-STPA6b TaxID=2585718 RepID=UPI001D0C40B2|nr:MFS transporter [Psychrobacter sp. I-STPA6b]
MSSTTQPESSKSSSSAQITRSAPSPRFTFWLVLIAIILLSANMRSPIVALGSIAPVVQEALHIHEAQIGWLGAVPMLMFAVGAFISPPIGKRFGLENTLIVMLVMLTVGIIVRSWWVGWTGFLVGTVLLSFAIGFANTLAAPIIKQRTPNHIALITGLFSLTMTTVAGLVAGVIYPLTTKVGWQWALGGWASLGVLAIAVWIVLRIMLGSSHRIPQSMDTTPDDNISIWRSPLAWQLAVFMGLQSVMFYTTASFLPSIWLSKGLSQVQAGHMASVFQFMAPLAILSLTWLIQRGKSIQMVAITAAALNAIGSFGMAYLTPSVAWLWSALMGLGTSGIFTLSIMLFSLRTYTPQQASQLSGMVQTIGYMIAIFGPLGAGWLHEITGSWDLSLLLLFLLMVVNVVFSYFASRPMMIDGRPSY